jgi:hypothetical protein
MSRARDEVIQVQLTAEALDSCCFRWPGLTLNHLRGRSDPPIRSLRISELARSDVSEPRVDDDPKDRDAVMPRNSGQEVEERPLGPQALWKPSRCQETNMCRGVRREPSDL